MQLKTLMGKIVSSYQREIEKYIGANKKLIAKHMGLSAKDVSTSDLRIFANFLSYRAGESHFLESGGKVDPRFIDDIRLKSRELKGPKALMNAIAWYERGVLAKGSIAAVIKDERKFSPKIEHYLQKRREENYKKAFEKMGKSVNAMKNTVADLTKLFNEERSLHDKGYVKELKATMNRLRGDMARCDYHARAGIAWALKVGIPFDHAKNGIHKVYLRHLQEEKLDNASKDHGKKKGSRPMCLASSLALIDETLASQGIKSSLSDNIRQRCKKWDVDLLLARFELQAHGKAVTREQKRVFEEAKIPTLTASI